MLGKQKNELTLKLLLLSMINQLVNSIPPAENTYKILIIMQAKQNIFEGIGKLPRHSKPEGPRSWLERDLEE